MVGQSVLYPTITPKHWLSTTADVSLLDAAHTLTIGVFSRHPRRPTGAIRMKAFVRGSAVLLTTASLLGAAVAVPVVAFAQNAAAQEKNLLTTDRAKTSYLVGHDIAQSITPVAPDMDLAAFERAISNAFEGSPPLIAEADAQKTGEAMMMRIASRAGKAPAGATIPEVDR